MWGLVQGNEELPPNPKEHIMSTKRISQRFMEWIKNPWGIGSTTRGAWEPNAENPDPIAIKTTAFEKN